MARRLSDDNPWGLDNFTLTTEPAPDTNVTASVLGFPQGLGHTYTTTENRSFPGNPDRSNYSIQGPPDPSQDGHTYDPSSLHPQEVSQAEAMEGLLSYIAYQTSAGPASSRSATSFHHHPSEATGQFRFGHPYQPAQLLSMQYPGPSLCRLTDQHASNHLTTSQPLALHTDRRVHTAHQRMILPALAPECEGYPTSVTHASTLGSACHGKSFTARESEAEKGLKPKVREYVCGADMGNQEKWWVYSVKQGICASSKSLCL